MNYKMTTGKYPEKPKNTENEYFGIGWSVKKETEKYYFQFISGTIQGDQKSVEITEDDYLMARAEKISFDELCVKYNVH